MLVVRAIDNNQKSLGQKRGEQCTVFDRGMRDLLCLVPTQTFPLDIKMYRVESRSFLGSGFFSGNLVADGIAVGADSSIMLTKQSIQGWGLCYATIETLQR